MNRTSCAVLGLLALLPACISHSLPVSMTPTREVTLREPLSSETLAVLDFLDERPAFERSLAGIDEAWVGSDLLVNDRFWSFHAEEPTLQQDPASPPDLRARVTGEAAFAWYPFPHHGIGAPVIRPTAIGIADYLALEIEQRGIFARVIRVRDAEEARVAGAAVVLSGKLARFGALLAVAEDPYVVRPDDWVEFRLLAAAAYEVELRRADVATPLLTRQCTGRDEELHPSDRLHGYAGSQAIHPYYRLDATNFPAFAEEDMGTHARRALERATLPFMADLEHALAPPVPAP